MYATITELSFKSPDAIRQATRNIEALLPDMRQLAGFRSLSMIQTESLSATIVTIYDSQAALEEGSAQLRPQVAQAIGPHVAGAPQRVGGAVLIQS
jgi:heme-degrading monooxygenase HmoA